MANRALLKRRAQIMTLMEHNNNYFGKGINMSLFPHGEKGEIWISDNTNGFKIQVSKGPHGLSIQIDRHAGTAPLSASLIPSLRSEFPNDCSMVILTQYSHREESQAFKRWHYFHHIDNEPDDEATKAAYEFGTKMAQQGVSMEDIQGSNPSWPEWLSRPIAVQRGYYATLAKI